MWNNDSTPMPAAMHRFYLRNFSVKNLLAKGELELIEVQVCLIGQDPQHQPTFEQPYELIEHFHGEAGNVFGRIGIGRRRDHSRNALLAVLIARVATTSQVRLQSAQIEPHPDIEKSLTAMSLDIGATT